VTPPDYLELAPDDFKDYIHGFITQLFGFLRDCGLHFTGAYGFYRLNHTIKAHDDWPGKEFMVRQRVHCTQGHGIIFSEDCIECSSSRQKRVHLFVRLLAAAVGLDLPDDFQSVPFDFIGKTSAP
jgi:hypothetical protein